MDSSFLIDALQKFEDRREERFGEAQKLISQYRDPNDLLVDIANIMAILFAANVASVQQPPRSEGFAPDSVGFRSDTK